MQIEANIQSVHPVLGSTFLCSLVVSASYCQSLVYMHLLAMVAEHGLALENIMRYSLPAYASGQAQRQRLRQIAAAYSESSTLSMAGTVTAPAGIF